MMEGQEIIKCPNCGSNKVQVLPWKTAIFATAGCFAWIPVIGWIVSPILLLIWFISLFITGKKSMRCQECKHNFKVKKSTYKRYKNYMLHGNIQ